MKILHTVEFYHPSVGGAQEVVKQLSEHLVKLGHDVTVATTKLNNRNCNTHNDVKIKEFNITGNMVDGIKGEVENYKQFILNSDFDIILNYAAQQWATDLILDLLKKISAKKIFVPCGFSGLYLDKFRYYYNQMIKWLMDYDLCIYLSHDYRDINFAKRHGINNSIVIPNGASEEEFLSETILDIRTKLEIPKEHLLILHVGSHTDFKGHTETIDIFKKANIADATLLIVADNNKSLCNAKCKLKEKYYSFVPGTIPSNKKIIVKSLTRSETIAAFHSADIFLFPSNIECSPLVIFEAMASKTPFLTTNVGNCKEIIQWSGGGELLPTIEFSNGFVKADIQPSIVILEKMFYDRHKRDVLKKNGYEAWKNSFTWETISKKYEKLYSQILSVKK